MSKYGFDAYLGLLRRLSPRGLYWRRSERWGQVLEVLARAIAKASSRIEDVQREANPANATDAGLLPDWIEALGLPDACTGEATAEAAAALLTVPSGPTWHDIIDLVERLGYHVGSFLEIDCTGTGAPAWLPPEYFCTSFFIELSNPVQIYYADVDNATCTTPLRWWGVKPVECAVNRAKPAHTWAFFKYPNAIP